MIGQCFKSTIVNRVLSFLHEVTLTISLIWSIVWKIVLFIRLEKCVILIISPLLLKQEIKMKWGVTWNYVYSLFKGGIGPTQEISLTPLKLKKPKRGDATHDYCPHLRINPVYALCIYMKLITKNSMFVYLQQISSWVRWKLQTRF